MKSGFSEKELPNTFMGHIVVASARVRYEIGRPKHRAIVVWMDSYTGKFGVHNIKSPTDDGEWEGWNGNYDFSTFHGAFVEFEQRLTREGILPPF